MAGRRNQNTRLLGDARRLIQEAINAPKPLPGRTHNDMEDDELRAIAALYCEHGNPKERCKLC